MISELTNVELPWYFNLNWQNVVIYLKFRIEKYRPQFLKDIVGNEEIVSRLEVIGKTGNIPNLLLSVPLNFYSSFTIYLMLIGPTWYW